MEKIGYWGSFGLGIITSLTPCSLALLVAALSFIIAEEENFKEGLYIGISFTIGMSLVFFIFGLFISKIGQFTRISHVFYIIAGILLLIFGIYQFGMFKRKSQSINIVQRIGFSILYSGKSKIISSFLLGILFSLGWAPCATSLIMPVAILVMSQEISVLKGGFLLFLFGFGHGFPVLILSVLSEQIRSRTIKKFTKSGIYISKIFGGILILIGLIFIIYGPKINILLENKK